MENKRKISIVIPAYNEERYLPRLLKSVISQELKSQYEIIAVDAESTDATRMIAKAYGCRVISSKRGSPAIARNAGAMASSGDILIFLDADVVLPKDFLRENLREFERRRLDVAGCYVKPESGNIYDDIVIGWVSNMWLSFFENLRPSSYGHCMFAKRETHRRIRGFDENLAFAEDSDYANRAFKKGLRFGILKSKRVLLSMRRFEKEGRIFLTLKYAILNLRRFGGEIKNGVKYNYGDY